MPVKIKKRLKVLTLIERTKPTYYRLVKRIIESIILDSISSGRSPVERGAEGVISRRYEPYSDSYKKGMGKGKLQNKKQRPVNLKLTGKLHRSIKSMKTKDFVRVWFTDAKAKYHDKLGAGKKEVLRRLVPDPKKGENFNAGIRKRLVKILEQAIRLSK